MSWVELRYSVSDWVLWWVSWRLTCIIDNDWQLLTMYHLLSLQVVLAAYLNIPCCSHVCVSHLSSYVFNVAAQVSLLTYLFPRVMLWWMSDVLVSFCYGSRLSQSPLNVQSYLLFIRTWLSSIKYSPLHHKPVFLVFASFHLFVIFLVLTFLQEWIMACTRLLQLCAIILLTLASVHFIQHSMAKKSHRIMCAIFKLLFVGQSQYVFQYICTCFLFSF